ncbi:hypothetical protein GWI33_005593 [Rhynchophorus ferrugineus]|uniref:Uncharacterized protein n=1 Tax=Rhynchophorus ferrugineus TaxID=354439 RepID=A0A834MJI0_RHYFE|nr:hypothetical protein GWI33_005593 [Rhynchophorus ferrugineus]
MLVTLSDKKKCKTITLRTVFFSLVSKSASDKKSPRFFFSDRVGSFAAPPDVRRPPTPHPPGHTNCTKHGFIFDLDATALFIELIGLVTV